LIGTHRPGWLARIGVLAILCSCALPAQDNAPEPAPPDNLPEVLRKLHTTARLLHTDAHPDDEDGGMLALESRGKGVEAMLLTLNRGEGGQNKIGSNLFDELGELRTLELLAADSYYGVEQRFTRVADFGFSKTPEETFQKWHGHDIPLGDMVRVIRTFRPDVIVSRFQGSSRDGHGHHQAAGILSVEAFHAAADPKRFPEQIKEGLEPWQAKKLYCDNVRADEDPTVKLNSGVVDPVLGMSYIQFAMKGLRHQLSQGAGAWRVEPGDRFSYYKLLESTLPGPKPEHEKDFFDGIDTSLVGLSDRAGADESKIPRLRARLKEISADIDKATADENDPAKALRSLAPAATLLFELQHDVQDNVAISRQVWWELLSNLNTKQDQLREAINIAAGVKLEVFSDSSRVSSTPPPLAPGQTFSLTVHLVNNGKAIIRIQRIGIGVAGKSGDQFSADYKPLAPGQNMTVGFDRTVPEDAAYTRPYFHRSDPETETVYTIDNSRYFDLPLPVPPINAAVYYSVDGADNIISSVAQVKYKAPGGADASAPLAIAPPFSLLIEPASVVVPLRGNGGAGAAPDITVSVSSNIASATGRLKIEAPPGWRTDPPLQEVTFAKAGDSQDYEFKLYPAAKSAGYFPIRAVLDYKGKQYSEGYSVVSRPDLDNTAYYYQPATQQVSLVDVKVPSGLSVGYVMGAGDEIPTILGQLGIKVHLITPEELATDDLSRYNTIILGIRAFDTRDDLRAHNRRLLDYVKNGGTLMTQYNAGVADFNSGHFTPFPAELSRQRVSVEEAPVDILQPDSPLFHYPNQITARDFDGWVQERGLYFMDKWDTQFQPLLSCHDPGEQPMQGGLLLAHYGKGIYLYNAYAFFRQLPNGVPGAVRLYVNLISVGQAQK